jgi:hypothetical protein
MGTRSHETKPPVFPVGKTTNVIAQPFGSTGKSTEEATVIDVRDAVARFERSTCAFLDALDGVSERVWRLRPAGEAWSLAETAEPVVLTDRSIRASLDHLLTAPLPAGAPRFEDAAISADTFGPAAPGLAEPQGRFVTRADGIAALVAVCEELVAWARGPAADLRAYGLPHPVFGVFDGIQ